MVRILRVFKYQPQAHRALRKKWKHSYGTIFCRWGVFHANTNCVKERYHQPSL